MSLSLVTMPFSAVVKRPTATTKATPQPSTPSKEQSRHVPSPGLWKHPRIEEITRRQRLSTFDSGNLQIILWNAAAFVGLWMIRETFNSVYVQMVLSKIIL